MFQMDKNDAMGVKIASRGYSDANLYVAYNSQSKITPAKVHYIYMKVITHF